MTEIRRLLRRGMGQAIVLASLGGLVGIGCGGSGGPPPPKTYPVRGSVAYRGGQPLSDGVIQFQLESDPTLTTKGDIGPDGTFELVTLFQNGQLQGAVKGQYRVTVIPRMANNKPVPIFQLPGAYTVKAGDNSFTIELEKPWERAPR